MNIQITNIELNTRNTKAVADRVKSAETRKKSATETIEEAWERIFAMKLSDADRTKLHEVKQAMADGLIGREPVAEGKKQGKFSKAEALRLYVKLYEIQREQKLQELVDNTPSNFVLLTDEAEIRKVVDVPYNALNNPEIALDTETTGLDVYTDVICGVSVSLPSSDMHYYIPFEPTEDERALPIEMLELLCPLIESTIIGKVLHNALFDMAMFERHGMKLKNVIWDTMTAMHVLNENEPKGGYKLKILATKYLGEASDTFDTLFGKDAQFWKIPLDIALVYAAKDTKLTWDLYRFQLHHMSKFPNMLKYYKTVEVPLLYVIYDLERHGYVLDLDFAKEYGEQLRTQAQELEAQLMFELTPFHEGEEPLNLNSNPQMKIALSKAIDKELPNMDAKKTLNPMRDKYPLIDKLLDYRKITKLSGTYIDTLPTKQNPVTKRWHSRFNTMGTVTGRFSSGKDKEADNPNEFNVQNQPYEARRMFMAPPGKVLVSADFKAQEIRCVAHLSGEPALIDAFAKGIDPYANMASKYYKRPYYEVNKNPDGTDTKERKAMKVGWLSMLYGTSKYTLAEQLKTTPENAQKFMDELFASMPVLHAWIKGNEEFVKKHGFVWMDGEQRKRRLPEAKWKRKQIPYGKYRDPQYEEERLHNALIGKAMRQATNARVQGSSAIQTKVTMIRAHEECKKREGWALWGSVHDELLFEIPEDFTSEDIEVIRSIMVDSYHWGEVANGTDIEVMKRWGESMTAEDWLKQREESE